MWYVLVCHVVFTLCVYKCQDFQPMWYILLFVIWFSPYVFINVSTFNQCDIYFCLSCGFHPMPLNIYVRPMITIWRASLYSHSLVICNSHDQFMWAFVVVLCPSSVVNIWYVRIGECPSNSPFLKDNGAEAHCF